MNLYVYDVEIFINQLENKMEKIIKQDNEVMKILKVSVIQRVICHTDKGILTLQIRKGENKYHLVLDAVPLDTEDNKELMDILFPAKVLEVPQVNKETVKKVIKKK